MLRSVILVATDLLNDQFAKDQALRDDLNRHEGKVVELMIAPINVQCIWQVREGQLVLLDARTEKPDLRLHGRLVSLFGIVVASPIAPSHINIDIEGDMEFGAFLKGLIRKLNIHWVDYVSEYFGDHIAYSISQAAEKTQGVAKRVSRQIVKSSSEYLREEKKLVPTQEEIYSFVNDVDEVKSCVDRLIARVEKLQANRTV